MPVAAVAAVLLVIMVPELSPALEAQDIRLPFQAHLYRMPAAVAAVAQAEQPVAVEPVAVEPVQQVVLQGAPVQADSVAAVAAVAQATGEQVAPVLFSSSTSDFE